MPLTIAGLVIPVAVLVRMKRDKELDRAEQSKMSGYIWFFVAAAVFWMIYDQGGSTLSIFGEALDDEHLLGWDFPTSWYQSLNPIFIMALAPVFAWVWLGLNRRGKEPSTVVKFASGLVLIGVSFFVFLAPLSIADGRPQGQPDVAGGDLLHPDRRRAAASPRSACRSPRRWPRRSTPPR